MSKKGLKKIVEARLHNYKDLPIQIKSLELEIEEMKNDYRGYGAISYYERTGPTYNISRTVENEVIAREKRLNKLMKLKSEKELEQKKIENALTCLDIIETNFFDLFYNNRNRNNMVYISRKMNMDRSYLYTLKNNMVHKITGMLYPDYSDLPLLN